MRVAVVGGKLQGVEAVYLAHKAGYETLLIDKRPDVPAAGLCDLSMTRDITSLDRAADLLRNVDLIVPALEDKHALTVLNHIADTEDIPFAFDAKSYRITASKTASNHLFNQLKLPAPAPWPMCGFPLIVKPDAASGSHGVNILRDRTELDKHFQKHHTDKGWVVQEFVEGPIFSLEIIGKPGTYYMPQVTDLHMDGSYDCKAVNAPSVLEQTQVDQMKRLTLQIAEKLDLKGIMDAEFVLGPQGLQILEIDARLPSQTPTAVFWSTGVNILKLLKAIYLEGDLEETTNAHLPIPVLYEHLKVDSHLLEVAGEHIMATADKLRRHRDFFGADEALTNYRPHRKKWVATMIYTADDRHDLLRKRMHTLKTIRDWFGCDQFRESIPLTASKILKAP
jgi:pyrrolysine biosynthesis protein PylC